MTRFRASSHAAERTAHSGPALWEGRSSVGGMLALRLPALIGLGLFIAGIASGAMMKPMDGQMTQVRVNGEWTYLDPGSASAIHAGFFLVFLLFFLLLLAGALVPVIRAARHRYRIDAGDVEMAADGVIDRIAIGEIRRVVANGYGAWHVIGIFGPNRQRIALQLGSRDAMRVLTLLRGMGVKCGKLDAAQRPAESVTLQPGESVRWRGRPGLGSFDAARAIAAIGLLMPLVILLLGLQWIWSSDPWPVTGFFFSGLLFSLVGYAAIFLIAYFHERLRAWFYDLFGTVMVTDRRIAWRTPFGGIYRDVAFAELIEAGIVEEKGSRAWVALTLRDGEDVRVEDLHAIPQADRFLAMLSPGAAR